MALTCPNGHAAAGSKFCRQCGASLVRTCPNGHQVPPQVRFCPLCGLPVDPGDEAGPPAGGTLRAAPPQIPEPAPQWPGPADALPVGRPLPLSWSALGELPYRPEDLLHGDEPDTSMRLAVPAADVAPLEGRPSYVPTLLVSLLGGLFGLIPAVRHSTMARQRGYRTSGYWWAFGLSATGLAVVVVLALVMVTAAGGPTRGAALSSSAAAESHPTPGSTSAPSTSTTIPAATTTIRVSTTTSPPAAPGSASSALAGIEASDRSAVAVLADSSWVPVLSSKKVGTVDPNDVQYPNQPYTKGPRQVSTRVVS